LSESHDPHEDSRRWSWLPRFDLATLMLVMLVFSVMGAAGYYLVSALRTGTPLKAVFIIFTLAAPMVLLVVLSCLQRLLRWWADYRQPR
jgi:hypothetical protein